MDILTFFNSDTNTKKPKLIRKGGVFTKTFLKYNRKLLREGKVNNYIDSDFIYNPLSGRLIKKQFDARYKTKKIVTKAFKRKYNYTNNVIKPKSLLTGNMGTFSNTDEVPIKNLLKENNITGKNKLVLSFDGTIFYDSNIDVSTSINAWWKNSYYEFLIGDSSEQNWIWNEARGINADNEDIEPLPIDYYIGKETKLKKNAVSQIFRDGKDYYCFYTAIIDYFQDKLENAKGQEAKKKIKGKLAYIQGRELKNGFKYGILQKYNGGMPDDKQLLSDMANRLNVGFDIEQPFCDEPFIKVRPLKPVRKVFKYINSRLNHLETIEKNGIFNNLYMNDYKEIAYTSREKLYQILEENKKKDVLTIYGKDSFGINKVKTSTNYYSLISDFQDTVLQFEKEIGFTENIFVDALLDHNLTEFLKEGTHYNITYDIQNLNNINVKDENIKHIDMKKAYSQFYNSKYYNGFMGIITNSIRPMNNYKGFKGCFYITDLVLEGKLKDLNEKLGLIYQSNNIYYDSELKFIEDNGGKFKVKYGVIGEYFDFRFNNEMLENKELCLVGQNEVKVPYYSKWCGGLGSINYNKKFYMKGKKEYFENLRTEADIYNTYDTDEFRITYDKKSVKHAIHITGQITTYQRLNMMEQLLKMNNDKLIRIVTDGIYYYDHDFKINSDIFHINKEKKDFKLWSGADSFISNNNVSYGWKCENQAREYNRVETHLGGGGAGKTHYNLSDKGLYNCCYIAPSWFLSCEKQKEYNLKNNNVLARLTDESLPYWSELMNRYNNLILDEISMYSEEQANFIIENFNGGIYFCGDLGFQLPPPNSLKEMTSKGKVIQHKKLYRFKCKKLLALVKYIRKVREEEIKGKKISSFDFIIKQFQKINYEEVKKIYNVKDLIITSENKFIQEINQDIQYEKYIVKNNTSLYKNGQIIYSDPKIQGVEIEKSNAFTIHKSQGKTSETKLFIDTRKIKSLRMIYTAITRARYWNQIYFF